MALVSSTFVDPWRLVSPGIVLVLGVVAAAGAGLLFRRARRGRRIGDVPHCPACDYVLTGLDTDAAGARCPECGAALDARPVPRGERTSEPFFALIGVMLLLLGVLMVLAASLEIHGHLNWYGLRRLETVLADAESPSPMIAERAWHELWRRQGDGLVLTPGQHERLVTFALSQRRAAARRPSAMMNWLDAALLDGKLSPAQREQFFANAASAGLAVRPTAVRGDPVPVQVTYQFQGPGKARVDLIDPTCDAAALPNLLVRGGNDSAGSTGGVLERAAMIDRPGRHTIRVTARVSIFRPSYGEPDPADVPLHQLDLPLTGETEVLETAPPGYIHTTRDEAMGQRLRTAIEADNFWFLTLFNPAGDVSGRVDVTKAPVAIAFDVFARVDGKLYPMGSVAVGKGRSKGFIVRTDAPAVKAATEIDVILRTSERAARQTLDLFEVWDGELVFPGVTVRRLPRLVP